MVKITAQLKGNRVVFRGLQKYQGKMRKGVERALDQSGLLIQSHAKKLVLKGPKTGRIYKRGKKVKHQSSAPGEPPASDTGRLVSSIVHRTDRKNLLGEVAAKVDYSGYLEQGTRRMKPRPFLLISVWDNIKKINKIFTANLRKASR